MLPQQVVIQMTGAYPFGGLGYQPPPNLQILVRKVIVLAPKTEHRIRLQLDIARRLPTDLVVKLLRVLEEPGKLHLFYEYVPYWLQPVCAAASPETLANLKSKMLALSSCFYQLGLKVPLTLVNAGLDSSMGMKYYVGLEFEVVSECRADMQSDYSRQVNQMWRELGAPRSPKSQSKNLRVQTTGLSVMDGSAGSVPSIATPTDQPSPVYRQQQHYWWDAQARSQQPPSPGKSVTSKNDSLHKRSCANTLQILSQIESKIDKLRGNFKKSQIFTKDSAKHQPSKKIPTKGGNWSKGTQRRLSGQPTKLAQLCRQVHGLESPMSLRTPQMATATKEDFYSTEQQSPVESDNRHPFQRVMKRNASKFILDDGKSQRSQLKQPCSKNDFEEIKKSEFEHFFQSKEGYVHEFLGVLEDEGGGSSRKTLVEESQEGKNRGLTVPHSQAYIAGPPSSRRNKKTSDEYRSPNNDEKHQELLERISRVIQQSALALQRYHRQVASSRADSYRQQTY